MLHNNFKFISSEDPVDYPQAILFMEQTVADIRHKICDETVWFLEHPPLYTAGTSANDIDLIDKNTLPIYQTGRGGQYTYHGPGQLIAYVMMDIQTRQIGIRDYIKFLEQTIIDTLSLFGIDGFIRQGRVGVWVLDKSTEAKIAAIGVRVRRGVTYHGIAININPDLAAFKGIVPCGIHDYGVTSLHNMGVDCHFDDMQNAFQNAFLKAVLELSTFL